MAPQLTATKGREARGLAAWMARATNSFPVPDSPKMSTDVEKLATLATSDSSSPMALLL